MWTASLLLPTRCPSSDYRRPNRGLPNPGETHFQAMPLRPACIPQHLLGSVPGKTGWGVRRCIDPVSAPESLTTWQERQDACRGLQTRTVAGAMTKENRTGKLPPKRPQVGLEYPGEAAETKWHPSPSRHRYTSRRGIESWQRQGLVADGAGARGECLHGTDRQGWSGQSCL